MAYQVKLEVFEGPFDLLLNLITKQKVDIYDVPVAKIADEYLAYLRELKDLDLEIATEFLLVATTLLAIKTSALLPKEAPPVIDEELSPEEARENLVARLIEYKKFKSVAAALGARFISEGKFFTRDADLDEAFLAALPDVVIDVDVETLRNICASLIKPKPSLLDAQHIAPAPLRVSDYAERISDRLHTMGRQTFKELTRDCATKLEIIVSFLAILELYKRGLVDLGQAETFGEIDVEPLEEMVAV